MQTVRPHVACASAAALATLILAPAAGADDRAMVHVDAPPNVSLEKRGGTYGRASWPPRYSYTFVCDAPCDRAVDLGVYRLHGDGLVATPFFRLATPGAVVLTPTMGSAADRALGVFFTILGGVSLLFGVTGLVAGVTSTGSARQEALWVGGGSAGVGVAALGTGIPLLVWSSSSVTIRSPRGVFEAAR
jgi:hypothetical protein